MTRIGGMVMRSHGDGRRMTIAEAIERRTEMIRFHGSLEQALERGVLSPVYGDLGRQRGRKPLAARAWTGGICYFRRDQDNCLEDASLAEDVDIERAQRFIVPCCAHCRAEIKIIEGQTMPTEQNDTITDEQLGNAIRRIAARCNTQSSEEEQKRFSFYARQMVAFADGADRDDEHFTIDRVRLQVHPSQKIDALLEFWVEMLTNSRAGVDGFFDGPGWLSSVSENGDETDPTIRHFANDERSATRSLVMGMLRLASLLTNESQRAKDGVRIGVHLIRSEVRELEYSLREYEIARVARAAVYFAANRSSS